VDKSENSKNELSEEIRLKIMTEKGYKLLGYSNSL
jgi:hypothetical protein